MEVDLLVVNYKTDDLLIRLVDTLQSDYQDDVFNLYIADNSARESGKLTNDGYPLWIERIDKAQNLKDIDVNDNVGYATAVNKMAYKSSADILCAVNADTWFTTNHVKQVIQSFKDYPKQAILGVKQMDEGSHIRHGGIFWDEVNNPIHRGWNRFDYDDELYKDRQQCWTVSGSIYYVRRSVWNHLTDCPIYHNTYNARGAFLPTFMYFEETFCSVHAQDHGYEVWFDGTIETAGHTWNASTGKQHTDTNYTYFNAARELYRKACEIHDIKHELDL